MKRYFPDPVLTKAASELQAREYIEHMDSVIEARGKEIEHLQGLIKDLRAAPIMEQPFRVATAIKVCNDELDKMDPNLGQPLPAVLKEKFKDVLKSLRELRHPVATTVLGKVIELETLYQSFFYFAPASNWRLIKKEDPFVDYLTKGRSELVGGHFTDDHIANHQYMFGLGWDTVAKERIRFLSRAAIELQEKVGLLTMENLHRFTKKVFVNLESGIVCEQPEISDEEILSQGELYLRNMNERKLDKGTLPSAHGDKTILANELSKLPETEVPKFSEVWFKFQQNKDLELVIESAKTIIDAMVSSQEDETIKSALRVNGLAALITFLGKQIYKRPNIGDDSPAHHPV